jgi:hypothetical protein
MVEQVHDYRFSTTDWPIATVRRRVAEIARPFNFRIDRWEEDGLGWAQGMLIRLASGRVILVLELEHLIERRGAKGPSIHIDAREFAEVGVDPLITEVLEALDLSRDDLDWIASEENRASAVDFLARGDRWLAEKTSHSGPNGT